MSHDAVSDSQLLDMAREVLSVGSQCSLKDILDDLAMTKSSQLTINRILDGHFLVPFKPEVSVREVTPADDKVYDEALEEKIEPSWGRMSQEWGPPAKPVEQDVVFLLSSSDEDDFQKKRAKRSAQEHDLDSETGKFRRKAPLSADLDMDISFNDENLPAPLDLSTVFSSKPSIIELQTTPAKHSQISTKEFRPLSIQDVDPFSDWDYELVQSPSKTRGAPAIIFSSPSPSSAKRQKTFSFATSSSTSTITKYHSTEHVSGNSISKETFVTRKESLSSKRIRSPALPDLPPLDFNLEEQLPVSPRRALGKSAKIELDVFDDDYKLESQRADIHDLRESSSDEGGRAKDWGSLGSMSLSPPTMFQDTPLDSDDEELMDDVFSSHSKRKATKKKALARSTSRTNVVQRSRSTNGKRAQDRMEVNLNEWEDSGEELGVVTNARQRRREKATSAPISDDENPRVGSKALAQEIKRKAKEARDEERAAAKAERARVSQEKRELREQEKLARDGEKEAAKKASRDLRIANRLTSKSESAKEMVLYIETSLFQSKMGETLQEYLVPIECKVSMLQALESDETASGTNGSRSKASPDKCPLRNMLYWRRIVSRRYDDEQEMFITLASQGNDLEAYTLLYIRAKDFATHIELQRFRPNLASVKRDMRLRKNLEKMRRSSEPIHKSLKVSGDRRQRQRVIYLIQGMDDYLRNLKKASTKKFQQAVLAKLSAKATDPKESTVDDDTGPEVDQERIEQELLWLQLEQDCLVIQTNDDDESAQAIVSLTEQIGLRPYKGSKTSSLNVCVEGIKSGVDARDTWIRSLQEIHMVTMITAKSIVEEYPTIKSLYEGYRNCTDTLQAEAMLEDIPILGKTTVLGRSVSKRIYDVFMSQDPERPIKL